MRAFITKLTIFTFLFLLFALILWLISYNYKKLKVTAKLKKIASHETLIMADSRMQRIDPAYFNSSAYNFSSTGEHYYITYQKIKSLISFKNCHVKQILLGVKKQSDIWSSYVNGFPLGSAALSVISAALSSSMLIVSS